MKWGFMFKLKNIFNKNKIGKNDNVDIGNNKNNKIWGHKNSIVNEISVNDNIFSLYQQKKQIETENLEKQYVVSTCGDCTRKYEIWMDEIKVTIHNDEVDDKKKQNASIFLQQIKNWHRVIVCEEHKFLGKQIEFNIQNIIELNYLINELLNKR